MQVSEDWLSENRHDIVYCPNQPGQLTISKMACIKRYREAQKAEDVDVNAIDMEEAIFRLQFKKGISLCRACMIAERMASGTLGVSKVSP